MTQQWKSAEALRESLLWTASSLAALGKEQDVIVLEGRRRTVAEILDEANEALEVDTPPAAPSLSSLRGFSPEACDGMKSEDYVNKVRNGDWSSPDCTPPASAQDDAKDERQPLFWYRPRSDDGYEGPIHNDRIEEVRKQSGAWVPLYPGFATLPKPLYDLRYHGEFIRGWNQCLQEVSASVAAPAAGDALDAARYRWLRDQEQTDAIAIVMKNKHFDDSRTCAENIDQFIDAAIAAQQGKGGAA